MSKKKKQKSMEELLEEALVPKEEQPYQVPENWVWVRFGDIGEIGSSKRVLKSAWQSKGVPFYRAREIVSLGNKEKIENGIFISEELYLELKSKYGVPKPNDLLITGVGTIGETYIVSKEDKFYFKDASVIWFRNIFNLNIKFINYYFKSEYTKNQIKKMSAGTTVDTYTITNAKKTLIPLAPISEQKRIAEKVERLFAKIDEAKRLIEEVKESLELRRAAILDKAFKGQLGTNDPNEMSMLETSNEIKEKDLIPKEEQPYEVPENWVWTRLGNLVHFIGGGTPSKTVKKYWDGNIPWATVKDIKGKYLLQTKDSITEEGLNNSSASLAAEEELIVVTRMSPGKAIISKIKTAINQDLKIVKPKTKIHSGFLWIFFEVNRPLIESLSTGSTVKGIQIKKLDELLISLPPYEEQKRIADKVDNLLSKLENEQELVLEVEEKLNLLKQSILNKAFRGELGTNDPNDEHAIELLKEVLKSKSK